MRGEYTIVKPDGGELSFTFSFKAARFAAKHHLEEDGEQGPLKIVGPDGGQAAIAELDENGRFLLRTSSLTRRYETEVSE